MQAILTFAVVLLALGFLFGFNQDAEVNEYPDILDAQRVRVLSCFEDEDIILTLGDNGLPVAWCAQAWER